MITYSTISKQGSRKVNEDSTGCLMTDQGFLAVLADGLGGHGKGEDASAAVVEGALLYYDSIQNRTNELLEECLRSGNDLVIKRQKEEGCLSEMKTTLTLLNITNLQAQWLHVGDSRIYYFRKGKLIQRTKDHSVPQMLVTQGEIKEKEIRFHEDRNRLLRVVGMSEQTPKYDLSSSVNIDRNTSFLLCSDGFWELIEEKDMTHLLKRVSSPEEWLYEMERIVLKKGEGKNMDNYSAIAVFCR